MSATAAARLRKELSLLATDPPPGICAWPVGDSLTHLQAQVEGPDDTPYARGIFLLDILVPDSYPFEPPKVRFVTPIYHPNIDSGGRICLDTLKMRPAGSWTPSINIPTLLTTIRTLIAHPNGDDGLMPEITKVFVDHRGQFDATARKLTQKHATAEAAAALQLGAPAPPTPPPAAASAAADAKAPPRGSGSSSESDGDDSDGSSGSSSSDDDDDDMQAPPEKKQRAA